MLMHGVGTSPFSGLTQSYHDGVGFQSPRTDSIGGAMPREGPAAVSVTLGAAPGGVKSSGLDGRGREER